MPGTTPSQTIGPFHRIMVPWEGGETLVSPDDANAIRIEGTILDGENNPVTDAFIEIWQANVHGRYAHPEDRREVPLVQGFKGFGRALTDDQGRFHFITVKPGRVPGRGATAQAPHISVFMFARGLLKQLVTRIYFSDETRANSEDPVLNSIEDEDARRTLIAAKSTGKKGMPVYQFNVRLQGEGETVFFDI